MIWDIHSPAEWLQTPLKPPAEPGTPFKENNLAKYSLKSFLRETQNNYIQLFLKREGVSSEFKWVTKGEDDKEIPLPETDVDGLAEAFEKIEGEKRTELICKIREIALLADQNIISTMIEQGNKTRYGIDLAKEFSDKEIEVPYDRVMWVNLYQNDLFRYTLKYVQVINIDGTRDFLIERKKDYKTDPKKMKVFKESIIKHYVGKGRGEKCIIDDYYTNEDVEQYCYYTFHEDSIKTSLDFNEDGDDVIRKPKHGIFENIFFFEPQTGNLRIHANGERNTEKLADLFCEHMLSMEIRPNRDTKIYDLSEILSNPDFKFDNDATIKKIHVTEIICDMGNNEEFILKTKNRQRKELLLIKRLHSAVDTYGADQSGAEIKKLRFQVEFRKEDGLKKKTRTREIVLPNRTDLADDSYDNIIRRHIIKKWKFKKSLPEKIKAKVAQDGIK